MAVDKQKILVTGAGGFMGSNMVAYLKAKGHHVRAVDKAFSKLRAPLFSQADEIIYLDLREQKSALLAVEGMDWVIHLASDMGGVGYFTAHDYTPYFNNMTMDMNMLKACEYLNIPRMYYSSSACIYPTHIQMEEGNAPKLNENMIYPANSDQMYGWEKLMMTKLCQRAPFDARVGIQHTVFGPYQEIEGERMKFPTAIATKAIESKKNGGSDIEIWGNGKQIRTFLYIDDACEKIYRVLNHEYPETGPVNIGSEEEVTVDQCAQICCEILGISPKFTHTTDKPSGILSRGCDNSKFNQLYGVVPETTAKEGFRMLIEWIQSVRTNE